MSSTTNHLTTGSRRIVFLALIVLVSIVFPIGLVGLSIYSAIWGKPFGRPSLERKIFQGFVKNGEFWYLVGTFLNKTKPARIRWQIRRTDLRTGIERNTELKLANDFQIPFLVNGEIFGSGNAISKLVDDKFVKVADWPISTENPGLNSYLFVDNGQLAVVSEIKDGEFKLLHLVDGQWVHGRKIRLPPAGSEWITDPQRGHKIKIPEGSLRPKFDGSFDHVWVSTQGEQFHVFVTYSNGFAAYRSGFDFVDDDQDTVSVLELANVASNRRDLSGWEPIQPAQAEDRWGKMICDREGVLIVGSTKSGRVVRRTNSGNWINVDKLPKLKHGYRSVLVDVDDSATYVLDADETWNSAAIYRLDGNTVQPRHIIQRGCYDEYLAYWQRCLAGIFLAWLMHLVLLTAGVAWLTRGPHFAEYLFGVREVKLASVPRRALACFADMMLVAMIVVLLTSVQVELCEIDLNIPSKEEFCRWIFEYDWRVYQTGFDSSVLSFSSSKTSPFEAFFLSIRDHQSFLSVGVIEILLLFGLKSYIEGRYGITPGKWLLGIRTVRTSLRQCGFARALVRSTLCCVDIPFFVTPIPAAVSTVLSRHRRRIGDLVADTVVVKADSI